MGISVCLAAAIALLSIPPDVHAHGYLKSPRSRNFVAYQDGVWSPLLASNPQKEVQPQGASIGGTRAQCGIIEGSRNYDFPKNALGGPLETKIQSCYQPSQTIDVEVELTAHHKGHFEFKACPISPGQAPTQACFDANKLRFISGESANFDPNYPERAYIPPSGAKAWNYRYKFQLPSGLSGDLVLLQWKYITANSCLPSGYSSYNFPSGWHPGNLAACGPLPLDGNGLPEQFWNCAEVRISNNCQGGPTPTPPTTPPPIATPTTPTVPTTPTTPTAPTGNCPAVTGQCGPSKTCASIGFPGLCCSQYGWCGTTTDHCGACCQNGPCTSGPTPPAPTPPPTPPTPTGPTMCPAVAGQCGPATTCASIGFPGLCCSQYGWCGTTTDHCGACCQNGPCTSGPTPPAPTPPPTPPAPTTPTTPIDGSLGDWELCSSNSQCINGCCSGLYSANVLKCTPLSGGFNPDICMANSPSTPTTPTPPPVPTTPPPTRWKTLNYLYSIRGRGTVAGMHERYSQTPSRFTEQARQVSGKYPGLWSGDFLFDYNRQYRQNMIDEAKRRWNAGTMINIMYHSCNPATANVGEECNYNDNYKGPWSKMSDSDWQAIITDGSGLNQKWKQYLDEISPYLLDLKNNGVEVLFRPFHEMNQGAFWWGGRPGASGTRRLYQISHDYLTNVKRLDNLIWVWNIQDFGSLGNDAQSYNPGSNYYEVASLDVYEGMQTWKYDVMRNVAGGKPIAIGECDVLPDASRLVSESLWTFFMSWSELTFEKNTGDKITSVYNQAITRDEMGDWQGGTITPPTTSPPSPTTPPPSPPTTGLGDWELCSSNSQCMNGCCSGMYSANVLKCTPLSGGFNPDICMANTPTTPSTSSKPTTTRPSTRKPTLTSGGSAKPTTRKPTTRKPTTRKPTQVPTNEPTTESPTTNAPTTDSPTTDSPTTESPTTQSPATESPTTESPTTESPTTSQPTSKPTSAKPTTRKPSTRKPTTRKPSTRKPTTGKPIL